jgi:hypothetical protein
LLSGLLTHNPTGLLLATVRVQTAEETMKAGYRQAAWRLFQVTLTPRPKRTVRVTWADTELEGTPFQTARLPLPVVRPKGMH